MKPAVETIRESAVRAMRDRVYGPISDEGWVAVRLNWMEPDGIKFLQEWCARMDLQKPKPKYQ